MKKKIFKMLIAVLLFAVIINCGTVVYAETDLSVGETEPTIPTEPSESLPYPDGEATAERENNEPNPRTVNYTDMNNGVVPDGIYAFKNLGNTNRWMDVRANSTSAGAYMQQYAFNGASPAFSYSASGLYKVTRIANTGTYTIRLMLN